MTLPLRGRHLDFVEYLNREQAEVDQPRSSTSRRGRERTRLAVEVAMQWTPATRESCTRTRTTINTHEGGTHEEGFRAALTTLVNAYAREKGILKDKDDNLSGDDVREGLTAIISRQAHRGPVRGPDQDQARQHRDKDARAEGRFRKAGAPTGSRQPRAAKAHHRQGHHGLQGARGGAQGPGPNPPQERAGGLHPAGQACRLPRARPGAHRALHRRGRLRGRLGH
jgi:hypothetical protein